MSLKINGDWFVDSNGRNVLLRGINLGGNCKYPARPKGYTHLKTDFKNHREVSFVGHPFPLNEAESHFQRLTHWGFNSIRFLVTWEAVEHLGPNQYDKEYLDYVEALLKIAQNHGFYTIINPHQDVWSRMTGGDGAPGWIFEKVGLDYTKFDASEAAYVMQYRYDPNNPKAFPPMYWSGNNYRFANCTMWTLFWGGKTFAPSFTIDGINVQDYLQQHYINSIHQIALRLKDNSYVIGFNVLNEPPQGWIEMLVDGSNNKNINESMGHTFTPIDAMATAAGIPRTLGYREVKTFGIKETRKDILNPNRVTCWLPKAIDFWQKEGVWGIDHEGNPQILKNDYFVKKGEQLFDFYRDFLSPFIIRYSKQIRSTIPRALICIEGPSERILKGEPLNFSFPSDFTGLINAPHWYDVATMGMKKPMLKAGFDLMTNKPILGKNNIYESFIKQMVRLKDMAKRLGLKIPTIISEFTLPMDLNNRESFRRIKTEGEKAWESHIECLSLYFDAIDSNLLHSLYWNYTPDNTNQFGDGWNLEDYSLFSIDQQVSNDVFSGGRAVTGFCRPHFVACAGIPLKQEFDQIKGQFTFEFTMESQNPEPTVVFIPKIQFPNGYNILFPTGDYIQKEKDQLLLISPKITGKHSLLITRK